VALQGLLGDGAPLSASSIERLRATWQQEYAGWKSQRIEHLDVVYAWADGLYVKAGLEDTKAALLVVIGALRGRRNVVLPVESEQRDSKESWGRALRDLRDRGLKPWRATVADGHLGIWSARGDIFPSSEEQRCWNHRLTNVIDHLPKKEWPAARESLRKIPYAGSRAACERLPDAFVPRYRKA
jgi:putative transposase